MYYRFGSWRLFCLEKNADDFNAAGFFSAKFR